MNSHKDLSLAEFVSCSASTWTDTELCAFASSQTRLIERLRQRLEIALAFNNESSLAGPEAESDA